MVLKKIYLIGCFFVIFSYLFYVDLLGIERLEILSCGSLGFFRVEINDDMLMYFDIIFSMVCEKLLLVDYVLLDEDVLLDYSGFGYGR